MRSQWSRRDDECSQRFPTHLLLGASTNSDVDDDDANNNSMASSSPRAMETSATAWVASKVAIRDPRTRCTSHISSAEEATQQQRGFSPTAAPFDRDTLRNNGMMINNNNNYIKNSENCYNAGTSMGLRHRQHEGAAFNCTSSFRDRECVRLSVARRGRRGSLSSSSASTTASRTVLEKSPAPLQPPRDRCTTVSHNYPITLNEGHEEREGDFLSHHRSWAVGDDSSNRALIDQSDKSFYSSPPHGHSFVAHTAQFHNRNKEKLQPEKGLASHKYRSLLPENNLTTCHLTVQNPAAGLPFPQHEEQEISGQEQNRSLLPVVAHRSKIGGIGGDIVVGGGGIGDKTLHFGVGPATEALLYRSSQGERGGVLHNGEHSFGANHAHPAVRGSLSALHQLSQSLGGAFFDSQTLTNSITIVSALASLLQQQQQQNQQGLAQLPMFNQSQEQPLSNQQQDPLTSTGEEKEKEKEKGEHNNKKREDRESGLGCAVPLDASPQAVHGNGTTVSYPTKSSRSTTKTDEAPVPQQSPPQNASCGSINNTKKRVTKRRTTAAADEGKTAGPTTIARRKKTTNAKDTATTNQCTVAIPPLPDQEETQGQASTICTMVGVGVAPTVHSFSLARGQQGANEHLIDNKEGDTNGHLRGNLLLKLPVKDDMKTDGLAHSTVCGSIVDREEAVTTIPKRRSDTNDDPELSLSSATEGKRRAAHQPATIGEKQLMIFPAWFVDFAESNALAEKAGGGNVVDALSLNAGANLDPPDPKRNNESTSSSLSPPTPFAAGSTRKKLALLFAAQFLTTLRQRTNSRSRNGTARAVLVVGATGGENERETVQTYPSVVSIPPAQEEQTSLRCNTDDGNANIIHDDDHDAIRRTDQESTRGRDTSFLLSRLISAGNSDHHRGAANSNSRINKYNIIIGKAQATDLSALLPRILLGLSTLTQRSDLLDTPAAEEMQSGGHMRPSSSDVLSSTLGSPLWGDLARDILMLRRTHRHMQQAASRTVGVATNNGKMNNKANTDGGSSNSSEHTRGRPIFSAQTATVVLAARKTVTLTLFAVRKALMKMITTANNGNSEEFCCTQEDRGSAVKSAEYKKAKTVTMPTGTLTVHVELRDFLKHAARCLVNAVPILVDNFINEYAEACDGGEAHPFSFSFKEMKRNKLSSLVSTATLPFFGDASLFATFMLSTFGGGADHTSLHEADNRQQSTLNTKCGNKLKEGGGDFSEEEKGVPENDVLALTLAASSLLQSSSSSSWGAMKGGEGIEEEKNEESAAWLPHRRPCEPPTRCASDDNNDDYFSLLNSPQRHIAVAATLVEMLESAVFIKRTYRKDEKEDEKDEKEEEKTTTTTTTSLSSCGKVTETAALPTTSAAPLAPNEAHMTNMVSSTAPPAPLAPSVKRGSRQKNKSRRVEENHSTTQNETAAAEGSENQSFKKNEMPHAKTKYLPALSGNNSNRTDANDKCSLHVSSSSTAALHVVANNALLEESKHSAKQISPMTVYFLQLICLETYRLVRVNLSDAGDRPASSPLRVPSERLSSCSTTKPSCRKDVAANRTPKTEENSFRFQDQLDFMTRFLVEDTSQRLLNVFE